jgi:hypothetical protein
VQFGESQAVSVVDEASWINTTSENFEVRRIGPELAGGGA